MENKGINAADKLLASAKNAADSIRITSRRNKNNTDNIANSIIEEISEDIKTTVTDEIERETKNNDAERIFVAIVWFYNLSNNNCNELFGCDKDEVIKNILDKKDNFNPYTIVDKYEEICVATELRDQINSQIRNKNKDQLIKIIEAINSI